MIFTTVRSESILQRVKRVRRGGAPHYAPPRGCYVWQATFMAGLRVPLVAPRALRGGKVGVFLAVLAALFVDTPATIIRGKFDLTTEVPEGSE